MGLTDRLDSLQQRYPALGFPVAVVYKYADDQGNYLAALITYYAFVSLFPLLLLLSTVLGWVLTGHPELRAHVEHSALSEFPVIGPQLDRPKQLSGGLVGILVGVLGALYGGLGGAQALQNAMNTAWTVPRNERPDPFRARGRSLLLLATGGLALLGTTVLSALGGGAGAFGLGAKVVALMASVAVNAGVFILAFRISTARNLTVRQVALGAGPQLLPPLRFYTDGDVVQAPENFLIGTKAEIQESQRRPAGYRCRCRRRMRRAGIVAVFDDLGQRKLQQPLIKLHGPFDIAADHGGVVQPLRRRHRPRVGRSQVLIGDAIAALVIPPRSFFCASADGQNLPSQLVNQSTTATRFFVAVGRRAVIVRGAIADRELSAGTTPPTAHLSGSSGRHAGPQLGTVFSRRRNRFAQRGSGGYRLSAVGEVCF